MKFSTLVALLVLLACASAPAELVHRWSFNDSAGAAPTGTTLIDSVSGSVAVVRGAGSTFTGATLLLPGTTNGNQTPAAISAYIDLPNGMISSKTDLTVEIWATPASYQAFQRLLDFGRVAQAGDGMGAAGEITGLAATAPGATQASDGLTLTLSRNGGNLNQQRFEGKLNGNGNAADPAGFYRLVDTDLATTAGMQYHYVLTFESGVGSLAETGGRLSWYRDGALAGAADVGFRLNQIEDVNNWLGRSLWSGDRQANAAYNEVRVYNHAFSSVELAASRAAGPSPAPPVAQPDAVTMHPAQKARIAVLANDTAAISAAIEQAPQSGTATVDAFGRILYTHTTGSPASDTFTYRASNAAGQSTPATVTINFASSLRITNSTLNIPATPPPTSAQLTPAFGALAFTQPVCTASPPGSATQLFVCEKTGSIKCIPDVTAAAPVSVTVLTLAGVSTGGEQGVLGLAFHPNYAANGYFYVFYSATISGSVYERVSRFTMANPGAATPTVTVGSEFVLIEQLDEASNHNGGDLHFGPDGYLYISLGDEGGQNDQYNNSQRIDRDFFSAILRIDVDKKPGSLAPNAHTAVQTDAGVARYAVPPDNPFVGASSFNGTAVIPANVRTEFWAVGLRNPWRFSFDSQTGDLWCGDVGQNTYEEVDIVTRGENYGWAFREGAHNGPKSAQAPASFAPSGPVYEYVHNGVAGGDASLKGNSITGGRVYRGARFVGLQGLYVFGDYVSGNIWTLARNGTHPPTVMRIAGEVGIVAFGVDPSNGDLLLADHDGNRILRLIVTTTPGTYPETLSATGLFADLTDLAPAPGVLPYTPNLPFWSDHAIKRRWFTVPDAASKMTWSKDGLWTFPNGTTWVKHFDMEMTRGNPATKKRIETRLLVKNATGAYGVSYRWNEAQTEATLVGDEGADFDLNVVENGVPRAQRWRIPSRTECLACHTPQAGHALSFTTRQMNRSEIINGFVGNQLTLLNDAGYFANSPGSSNLLPRHLRPEETAYPVETRVRSYLAVNCAYCHQQGGTASPAAWDGRPELALAYTGLVNGTAINNGGNPANKLIVPGDTVHSIVYNRAAAANGFTRMPPLGTAELDQANLALLTEWIMQSLPSRQTYDEWRLVQFGSNTSSEGEPLADFDRDGASNTAEFLALTNPLDGGSFLAAHVVLTAGEVTLSFDVPANRSAVVETSVDLQAWSLWDVPGNAGLPLSGGPVTFTGPILGPKQFFRLRLNDN